MDVLQHRSIRRVLGFKRQLIQLQLIARYVIRNIFSMLKLFSHRKPRTLVILIMLFVIMHFLAHAVQVLVLQL
jgi:hypothetical protein